MKTFSKNTQIKLSDGRKAIVRKLLGSGGQGAVYLVDLDGQPHALKWYSKKPTNQFLTNLNKNIAEGSPSPIYLWPVTMAKEKDGGIGYIMPLCPDGYYEFSKFRLMKIRFSSFRAILTAAIQTCEAFRRLHAKGLSYQDLNDGGFFINPATGDVKICDCDNVFPHGESSGIIGKARYIAPEVVMGKNLPNSYSDRFSMALMIFMFFCIDHPFEGIGVTKYPCLTEEIERSVFGKDICFIFDPERSNNRPVVNIHGNALKIWPLLPKELKDAFIQEFSISKLGNPQQRLTELEWETILMGVRDNLVRCPKCGDEAFVGMPCLNPHCKTNVGQATNFLKGDGRKIPVISLNRISFGDDCGIDAAVIKKPKDVPGLLLRNLTSESWRVQTPSGRILDIAPRGFMPVKPGLKITININNNPTNFQII